MWSNIGSSNKEEFVTLFPVILVEVGFRLDFLQQLLLRANRLPCSSKSGGEKQFSILSVYLANIKSCLTHIQKMA